MAYVKRNQTPIDFSIVAKKGSRTFLLLRDKALANPRAYIEGQTPTEIVYQNIFNADVPVSGAFGAGNNINLAQDYEGEDIASFAFGDTLSATNANQFVIGYNNEPDATKAFIVANSGNIFTVDYDGNVEAGDLNVGAISATSITVSGEDLNSLVDDKVEYLSTAVDDKLSATEDWVSNTFETKDSATQTFNELEGDIGQISAFVSGLPTDIAAKADQIDVDAISSFVSGLPQDIIELSGTVEGLAETKADLSALQEVDGKFANYTPTETIAETYATKTSLEDYAKLSAIPTGNAQLENTANYITAAEIPSSYVQRDQLDDYATVASLTAYAEKGDVPVLSSSISAFLAEGANIKLTVNDQTGVVTISGTTGGSGGEGKTYTGASGIVVDNENDIIGISATIPSVEGLASESWVEDNFLSTSYATTIGSNTERIGALETASTSYATKEALDELSSATSGLPSRVEALETAAETYALKADIPVVSSYVASTNIAIEPAETPDTFNIAMTAHIPTTVAELTDSSDYALVANLPTSYISSSDVSGIASAVTTGIVTKEYVNALGIEGTTYTAGTGLGLDQTGGKHEFYLTATIPTSSAITGLAKDYVDSLNLADTYADKSIETTVDTLQAASGDFSQYYTKEQVVPSTSAAMYEAISGDVGTQITETVTKNYITGLGIAATDTTYDAGTGLELDANTNTFSVSASWLTGQVASVVTTDYLTGKLDTIYAPISLTSDVAGNTQAINYISSFVSGVPTSAASIDSRIGAIEELNIATNYATKTELQNTTSAMATTGYVTGYCSAFLTEADLPDMKTKLSQFQNDTGFITVSSLSSVYDILSTQTPTRLAINQAADGTIVLSAAAGSGGGGTVDVETLSGLLSSANNNLTIEPSGDVILFTANGGGGSDITDVSDLNNDIGFITASDITNKQRVLNANGSIITYNTSYEVFKTTYTGASSVDLSAVTVPAGTLSGADEVATFEEWATFSSDVTTLSAVAGVDIIGEMPTPIASGKIHVLVRRLYNDGESIKQYVSYAYNF